jgi:hypothetical protein
MSRKNTGRGYSNPHHGGSVYVGRSKLKDGIDYKEPSEETIRERRAYQPPPVPEEQLPPSTPENKAAARPAQGRSGGNPFHGGSVYVGRMKLKDGIDYKRPSDETIFERTFVGPRAPEKPVPEEQLPPPERNYDFGRMRKTGVSLPWQRPAENRNRLDMERRFLDLGVVAESDYSEDQVLEATMDGAGISDEERRSAMLETLNKSVKQSADQGRDQLPKGGGATMVVGDKVRTYSGEEGLAQMRRDMAGSKPASNRMLADLPEDQQRSASRAFAKNVFSQRDRRLAGEQERLAGSMAAPVSEEDRNSFAATLGDLAAMDPVDEKGLRRSQMALNQSAATQTFLSAMNSIELPGGVPLSVHNMTSEGFREIQKLLLQNKDPLAFVRPEVTQRAIEGTLKRELVRQQNLNTQAQRGVAEAARQETGAKTEESLASSNLSGLKAGYDTAVANFAREQSEENRVALVAAQDKLQKVMLSRLSMEKATDPNYYDKYIQALERANVNTLAKYHATLPRIADLEAKRAKMEENGHDVRAIDAAITKFRDFSNSLETQMDARERSIVEYQAQQAAIGSKAEALLAPPSSNKPAAAPLPKPLPPQEQREAALKKEQEQGYTEPMLKDAVKELLTERLVNPRATYKPGVTGAAPISGGAFFRKAKKEIVDNETFMAFGNKAFSQAIEAKNAALQKVKAENVSGLASTRKKISAVENKIKELESARKLFNRQHHDSILAKRAVKGAVKGAATLVASALYTSNMDAAVEQMKEQDRNRGKALKSDAAYRAEYRKKNPPPSLKDPLR